MHTITNSSGSGLMTMLLLLILLAIPCDVLNAQIIQHSIIYDNIPDSEIKRAVDTSKLIITGSNTKQMIQMKKIKAIKPDMIILLYEHAIGSYKPNSVVSGHEEWFAHGGDGTKRLIASKYGWYLMNISNKEWRDYISALIVKNTIDSGYDGIFMDDMWGQYVEKFILEGSSDKGTPLDLPITNWRKYIIMIMQAVREKYQGWLFINSTEEEYMTYIDGFMFEGFIHGNSSSDASTLDQSSCLRGLNKVARLQKYRKKLLLASGTEGKDLQLAKKWQNLCYLSYLLIQNENTTFSFQQSPSYIFKNSVTNPVPHADLGKPLGEYFIVKEGQGSQNLLPNGSFENGLSSWSIVSGLPTYEQENGMHGGVVRFISDGLKRRDMIRSHLIPVLANGEYRIRLSVRANNNEPGTADYMKLGLQGRFYDGDMKRIPGSYDLEFGKGSYDWQPYEVNYRAPSNAAYFQISIGFIGDGTGTGWLDNLYFGKAEKNEFVLERDFENGSVFVNYGDKEATISLQRMIPEFYRLDPGQGIIVDKISSLPHGVSLILKGFSK